MNKHLFKRFLLTSFLLTAGLVGWSLPSDTSETQDPGQEQDKRPLGILFQLPTDAQ